MNKVVFAFLFLFILLSGCHHYELLSTGPSDTGENVMIFEVAGNGDAGVPATRMKTVKFKAGSELTESVQ